MRLQRQEDGLATWGDVGAGAEVLRVSPPRHALRRMMDWGRLQEVDRRSCLNISRQLNLSVTRACGRSSEADDGGAAEAEERQIQQVPTSSVTCQFQLCRLKEKGMVAFLRAGSTGDGRKKRKIQD